MNDEVIYPDVTIECIAFINKSVHISFIKLLTRKDIELLKLALVLLE